MFLKLCLLLSMNKLFGGISLLGFAGFMILGFTKADLSDQPMLIKAMTFGIGVGLPATAGVALVQSHQHNRKLLGTRMANAHLTHGGSCRPGT